MSQTILIWGRSALARRVAYYIEHYGKYRDIDPRFVVFEEPPLSMEKVNDAIFKTYSNQSGSGTPDAVINMWEVDNLQRGEFDSELSFTENTMTAAHLALACRNADVRLLHVSTSHVFSGNVGHRSIEDDPNPISVYGLSKLKAEEAVLTLHEGASVLRLNPTYEAGHWPLGMRYTVEDRIEAATDVGGVPQFAGEAAFLIARNVLESPVLLDDRIIHCASPETVEPKPYFEYFSERFPEAGFRPFRYSAGPGAQARVVPMGPLVALSPTKGWNLSNDPVKHWNEYLVERERDAYIQYF